MLLVETNTVELCSPELLDKTFLAKSLNFIVDSNFCPMCIFGILGVALTKYSGNNSRI